MHPLASIELEDPCNKLSLFRVKKDYGFNSHGCRNLIMSQTANEWVVLLDCDRIIVEPEYAFNLIRNNKLDKKVMYKFVAHSDHCGVGTHRSVNDYLIHRDHFFSAGGYDEELIGVRDGDRSFFRQLIAAGGSERILQIDMVLTRRSSVTIGGAVKSKHDRGILPHMHDLLSKREVNPDPAKPILTFEWEKIIKDN